VDAAERGDNPEGKAPEGDCVIPAPIEPEALARYLLKSSPFDGADDVRSYVEWQSPEERVTYLERIGAERVVGRDHETWDVHTTGERYWVITNPTNLYSQRTFPSADFTLTVHVGLAARMASLRKPKADAEAVERLAAPWRRLQQAGEALDRAHEAEELQAVGMRCRECLLALAREIADSAMVPAGEEEPQAGNFLAWSELIANALAGGASAKEVRAMLKAFAKATWQLVAWLTHASGATRHDGELARARDREHTRGVLRCVAAI
jgi:hypothetical protein